MKRFETLDVFRGLAALAVVLLHYTYGYRLHYGHFFSEAYDFRYGYLGVEFFFIISGFVIFLTLNHSSSAFDFLYKRFSRLYPVFWACMLTTFSIVYFFGLPGREKGFYNLKGNLTMIPGVLGYSAIDGAYWSLVPEFFFYIAMAVLLSCKNKMLYLFWGIAIIGLSVVNYYHPLPSLAATILNVKYGSLFFSGILFYKIKNKEYVAQWHIILLLVLALATTMINLENNTERIIVACFYPIFYLFAIEKLNSIRWKPLLFIGKISFPLYLLHQNIGYVIMNCTKAQLGNYPIIFIGLPIILLIILAYLIHRFIELPSIKFLRSLRQKISKPAPAQP